MLNGGEHMVCKCENGWLTQSPFLLLYNFKFREGSFEALLNTLNRINIYDEGTQTQLGSGHQMALNGDEMMR